ncbi:YcbK family protein [Mesorhizobium xinjiangense]|uniref:YcbK family protein n=1 Tax=Mesorhizobium xinjiangense TaxID=2678685 RepID=UPI001F4710A7|nr:YcbK family protein [Mesorhizobium xinjiangense]
MEAMQGADENSAASDGGSGVPPSVIDADDEVLPAEVAYVPTGNPAETTDNALDRSAAGAASGAASADSQAEVSAPADVEPASAKQTEPTKRGFFATLFSGQQQTAGQAAPAGGRRGESGSATDNSAPPAAAAKTETVAAESVEAEDETAQTRTAEANTPAPQQTVEPTAYAENTPDPAQTQKRGFLASLFSGQTAQSDPQPIVQQAVSETSANSEQTAAKPLVQLASVSRTAGTERSDSALPGVRQDSLFEITRKSGLGNDDDVDLYEESGSVDVASAAGLARLAPNGLLKQTDGVDVGCLKPSLVRVLKTIERHYGKRLIVTSGYRNPERNRRARGARNSLHMYCAAADVQVPGVSKWELAKYVRSMSGRGGVGTYCHTKSVHVDVGPERDWNWRCRRRSRS